MEAIMKLADSISNLLGGFGLDLDLGSLTDFITPDLFKNITDVIANLKDVFAGLGF